MEPGSCGLPSSRYLLKGDVQGFMKNYMYPGPKEYDYNT